MKKMELRVKTEVAAAWEPWEKFYTFFILEEEEKREILLAGPIRSNVPEIMTVSLRTAERLLKSLGWEVETGDWWASCDYDLEHYVAYCSSEK